MSEDEQKDDYESEQKPDKKAEKKIELNLSAESAAVLEKKGYILEKRLNAGAFGVVYRGYKNDSKEPVAIKVMICKKLGPSYQEKFWPRELKALTSIHHPNVIRIEKIWRMDGMYFIAMEFANGGDLTGQLKKYPRGIPEPITCYWFTHATCAMHYIHTEVKMAHRDMKMDNVMLHNYIGKVTDFGFARTALDEHGNVEKSATLCGTQPYFSPQMTAKQTYSPLAADCYAMGVMLFCMLNNRFPFHWDKGNKEQNKEQTTNNFVKTRYIKKFSADLVDLIEKLLEVDEDKRFTMAQTLEHPWIMRKGK